jgi:low temperature requirement protein LtrA
MTDDDRERRENSARLPGTTSTAAMGDEVSPVELLFDLVFVFAISQLSHHLLEHLTWRGALETGVLLMAVFGIWSLISFGASMPGISRRAETCALFTVLVLGLFFNAGLTRAFEDAPWLFAAPFLVCNIGIVFFYLFASSSPTMRRHAVSMLIWTAGSTALWVTGALAEPENRLWWWLLAALIDLVGAWSAHRLPGRMFPTAQIPFAPAHMIERSRLFLIIALGETILTTGSALANAELDASTIASGVLALLGTVALWGLYFGGSQRLVTEHATRTGDPLQAARLAVNGQVVTAAGLIVVAVGYEITIHHPLEPAPLVLALLLFGGPLLYLGLQTWYLRALTGRFSRSRLTAAAVLVIAGAVAWTTAAVFALAVSSLVLGLLAVRVTFESRRATATRA